jgi:predicted RNA binding protein YcfA (HicA-like mRNA interferase family)
MGKPHRYREVVKILRQYDSRFEFFENRAKGSERMIYHPDIGGRPASFPVKCHGEGTELRKGVISAIIRRFNLPRDLFS